MNKLEKTVHKLQKYPTWVLSFAIGRVVKFVGTASCSFDVMTKEKVVISLRNKPKVRNHIGQIHAAAMVLLAETATGMVVGMNIPDDKLPLMKSIQSKFVKRSQGKMQAEATLTAEQVHQINTLDKGEVTVPVKVTDEIGQEPVICEMVWAWIPKKKK
ncbi:DUF4442 domain-containing protein [Bernardetia sp.]|uniref:DUF4442 domain-containing protein n=1 Tax=Bernardetia sp. TaxID=1937974 RepID=UPI0025BD55F5|nr:DUF4442 domain-containing protein [Bernardetia sp.]